MAQRLTVQAAEAEAVRLLQMALVMLDQAEAYLASASVAHALDLLDREHVVSPGDRTDLPDSVIAFRPTWGSLVDR